MMAVYTMELRELAAYYDIQKLAMRHYPIFDEGYRIPLNRKIIDHYWMQEIGQETPDLFMFYLRRKMNEIMPYYNQLYKSTQHKFDPLSTVDLRTMTNSEDSTLSNTDAHSSSETAGQNSSQSVASDFPQTLLNEKGDYATSGSRVNGDTSGTSNETSAQNSNASATSLGESLVTGRQGSAAGLIMEYRQSLLNVDMMIVDDLQSLFMGVWNAGDYLSGEPTLFPYSYGY